MCTIRVFCVGIFIVSLLVSIFSAEIDTDLAREADDLKIFEGDNALAKKFQGAVIKVAVSTAGEMVPAIPIVVTFIEDLATDDVEHIRSIAREEIVANDLNRLYSALNSVKSYLSYLEQPGLTYGDKVSKINDIRHELQKIINELNTSKLFKEHAYKMMRLLSALTLVIPIHTKFEANEIGITNKYILPCEILNTITNYNPLAYFRRVDVIKEDKCYPRIPDLDKPGQYFEDEACLRLCDVLKYPYNNYFTKLANVVKGMCQDYPKDPGKNINNIQYL